MNKELSSYPATQELRLCRFIRSHDIACEPASAGRIRAIESFTLHGSAYNRIVLLPATLGAVRDWLGY